ncbi:MAG TPA: KGK domain-containing protein [Oculatellaceae cyanobacterium]|jgi:hypothetical protein
MSNKFDVIDCNDDDVLSFGDATFKVRRFTTAVRRAFGSSMGRTLSDGLNSQGVQIDNQIVMPSGKPDDYKRWFGEGINCEILKLGYPSWKKGKVRIKVSVEFYMEEDEDKLDNQEISEPESPLDDLRRMINEQT